MAVFVYCAQFHRKFSKVRIGMFNMTITASYLFNSSLSIYIYMSGIDI